MNFLAKVDLLMSQKKLNKHTLSIKCDIPYTTIDGWYKKGYEGAKLSTAKKLADFFNTTVDYLIRDEITDIDYVAQKKSTTSTDSGLDANEQMLIDSYRNMTSDGQRATLDTVKALYGTFKNKIDNISNNNQVG